MSRGPIRVGFAFVAVLACTPKVEPEPPEPPEPPPAEASAVTCPPIALDEAAEMAVEAMEGRGWRYHPDEGWVEASSVALAFDNVPMIASVTFGVPSSREELDAAMTLPTGAPYADLEPITDEQLAGIGDRAIGFSVRRVVYEDHPRGTRRREWKYAAINFVRCGVFVHVGGEFEAEAVVPIARELHWWFAKQVCC